MVQIATWFIATWMPNVLHFLVSSMKVTICSGEWVSCVQKTSLQHSRRFQREGANYYELHYLWFSTDNVKNLGEVLQFDDELNLDAKVWDIFLLLPSFVFLLILGYSSPRTRQQVKLSIDRIETMLVVEKSWRTDHGCDYSSTFQLAKAPSILPKTLHLLILTGGVGFCFFIFIITWTTHTWSKLVV